jgi:hypothetical protein
MLGSANGFYSKLLKSWITSKIRAWALSKFANSLAKRPMRNYYHADFSVAPALAGAIGPGRFVMVRWTKLSSYQDLLRIGGGKMGY